MENNKNNQLTLEEAKELLKSSGETFEEEYKKKVAWVKEEMKKKPNMGYYEMEELILSYPYRKI